MPRFMGFVRMEENIGTPPQALFDAMDVQSLSGPPRACSSTAGASTGPRTP
jgi:hypothetical protein